MDYQPIVKPPLDQFSVSPNLNDWKARRAAHSWDAVRAELDGLPNGGGLNLAHEAIDRHANNTPDKVAMRWVTATGEGEDYTYADMKRLSNRFANALRDLGIQKTDRVFVFMDRTPELYAAVFGTLKNLSIIGPLFSAFGPEPVRDRLQHSHARVLVTTPALYKKVEQIRADLPHLEHVLLTDHGATVPEIPGTQPLDALLNAASEEFEIPPTAAEDWSVMHYTSGTTGKPKGAAHVHSAVLGHYLTGKYALDLHPEDLYWCTADPGWVTGTSYGMFAPWTNGVTNIIYAGGFGARGWYRVLQDQQVTVWYTAPTAIRMLMKAGTAVVKSFDTSALRFMASVGEPLNPEAVLWGQEAFGIPFHDNWWQTETGMIMIANYASQDIRPGSMGRPMPGVEPAIIQHNEASETYEAVVEPGVEGDLAVRPGWPSMFRTYWEDQERYASRFKDGWYLTGDRARRDADGYFWFVGRSDDVINTAGHLVGPFEVESALIEHEAVAEAGVIGKPDPIAMEIVKAFVALKDGYTPSDSLRNELIGFARRKLGPGVAPREIDFLPSLPKTRSGKIMRRLLKARELGLPEGDTSTLEED